MFFVNAFPHPVFPVPVSFIYTSPADALPVMHILPGTVVTMPSGDVVLVVVAIFFSVDDELVVIEKYPFPFVRIVV